MNTGTLTASHFKAALNSLLAVSNYYETSFQRGDYFAVTYGRHAFHVFCTFSMLRAAGLAICKGRNSFYCFYCCGPQPSRGSMCFHNKSDIGPDSQRITFLRRVHAHYHKSNLCSRQDDAVCWSNSGPGQRREPTSLARSLSRQARTTRI